MSKNNIYRRGIAGLLAGIVAIPNLLSAPASAEETEKYQYNLFGRNGIELTADNSCSNGNWHTNKSVSVSCVNRNFNGTLTTEADIVKRVKHVYADQKIYNTYFTDNCELLEEEYSYTDLNININSQLFCYGNINLNGNVSLNSNLGTLMNLNITGEVKNANNSVVYSKYGNITIENNSTANINGLIYAPLGTLTINSPNVNINGIVIADKVVINGNCVNINNNDNIARFVGNISEAYDFSGLEYLPEEWLGDTDEDGLFDIYEKVIDSDPLDADTDDDGLPDGYEVLTLGTDPLEVDTDENGISDAEEDFDSDNLNNLDEYINNTQPFNPDTDEDGFMDGSEVYTYGTDPLNPDTDNDGLLDGEESYDGSIYTNYGVYFDPLNPDTNGNGILDGNEVFGQSKQQKVETYDDAITEVNVEMDTNGNLERNLTIESMYGIDAMSSNVYAIIGEPFNFTSSTSFESATISFKVDQSKLGDTDFDNLIILWYNEEDQRFEEMPTTRDAVNSTVSTTTTHFSQYMVVDSVKWYENWERSLDRLRTMWVGGTSYRKCVHTIFLIDCSASMNNSDKISYSIEIGYNGVTEDNYMSIINDMDSPSDVEYNLKTYGKRSCNRTRIPENVIANKGKTDCAKIITFSDDVEEDSGFSLYSPWLNKFIQKVNSNGTNANLDNAISQAFNNVVTDSVDRYRFVVLTDRNINVTNSVLNHNWNNSELIFVNLGNLTFGAMVDYLANATGGTTYDAISADSLAYESGEMIYTPEQYIGEDSDGDSIPDIVELYGLKPNGEPIGTNPYSKDTDGDTIPDNIELHYAGDKLSSGMNIAQYVTSMHCSSDPTKKDSDDDGYNDYYDHAPQHSDINIYKLKSDYMSIDYSTADPTECEPGWINHLKKGDANPKLSYGGRQNWFDYVSGIDNGSFIKKQGCGLIAMADVLLYLSRKNDKYDTMWTHNISKSNPISFDEYKKYVLDFNSCYVQLGPAIDIDVYFMWFKLVNIKSNKINNVDGNLGIMLNKYFKDFDIDLDANWGSVENSIYSEGHWFETGTRERRIRDMIKNDIPAIISVGAMFSDDSIHCYDLDSTPSAEGLHFIDTGKTIANHYFTVTGIIDDEIKKENGDFDAIMYEISSWGEKYYVSEAEIRKHISHHSSLFSNVLYIEEK